MTGAQTPECCIIRKYVERFLFHPILMHFLPSAHLSKLIISLYRKQGIFIYGKQRKMDSYSECFSTMEGMHIVSSPDPKGQVSYCHHLASVVCRPFVNISIFFQRTTEANGTKHAWNVYLHGLTKCCYFCYDWLSNMAVRGHKIL